MKINWSSPTIGEEEKKAVQRVLDSGWLSQGPETKAFERELGSFVGNIKYCVVVNNGTSALIAALLANNIGPEDEVIIPAHTFIAPINAVLAVGAKPILVDADPLTWNITPDIAKKVITSKTKAILPVNVAGMPVDIYGFQDLSKKKNISLIVDAAESFGGEYNHRLIGDIHFEHTSIFSFHIAKQLSTIEGGCIFTDNEEIHDKCRMIRDHGMNGRYNFATFGLNFRITDIQSAIGREQLKKVPKALKHRAQCVALYKKYLGNQFDYQQIPDYVTKHPNLFFGILTKLFGTPENRNKLVNRLNKAGIDTRICWPYILDQQFHKTIFSGQYDVAKNLSERIITLPLSNSISFEDIKTVCNTINEVSK